LTLRKSILYFLPFTGPWFSDCPKQLGRGFFLDTKLFAQRDYSCIDDNRGTGARGEEFKKCTYLQLGKYETIDQINAARYLDSLPFVDKDRIGIWGWSFGGYMVLSCVTKGSDYFKVGVAVAPAPTGSIMTIFYTERYMRTPKENSSGMRIIPR